MYALTLGLVHINICNIGQEVLDILFSLLFVNIVYEFYVLSLLILYMNSMFYLC